MTYGQTGERTRRQRHKERKQETNQIANWNRDTETEAEIKLKRSNIYKSSSRFPNTSKSQTKHLNVETWFWYHESNTATGKINKNQLRRQKSSYSRRTQTHTPFGRCYLYRLWKYCVKIECGKRISNWNTVPRRQVECKRTEQHINQIKIKTRNCLKMDKCRCRMHFKHMWLDRACIEFGSSEREKERERKRNKKRIRKLAPARVLNKRERGLGAGLMKGHLRSERYKLNFPMCGHSQCFETFANSVRVGRLGCCCVQLFFFLSMYRTNGFIEQNANIRSCNINFVFLFTERPFNPS